MSGKTDPPDWLDELYQEGNSDGPSASVDASIRAAARGQSSARPWYLRTRSLASAATIILGLGITALWMNEPDLAELAAPSAQQIPAESKVADQPKKQRLQTINQADLHEQESIGRSQLSVEKSLLPAAEPERQELQLSFDTANATEDSETTEDSLSAARSSFTNTAGLARSPRPQLEEAEHDAAMAADLMELPRMPDSLKPGDCETLTLIDVATTTPYGLCRQHDQLRVYHPSCAQGFELSEQTVTGDRDARSLIIVDNDERSHLTCNPQTGRWLLVPLPATQLEQ